jgi:hypothetical protein
MGQPIPKANLQAARSRVLSYLDREHPTRLREIPWPSMRELQCAALSLVKDGLADREKASVYFEGARGYVYTLKVEEVSQ